MVHLGSGLICGSGDGIWLGMWWRCWHLAGYVVMVMVSVWYVVLVMVFGWYVLLVMASGWCVVVVMVCGGGVYNLIGMWW